MLSIRKMICTALIAAVLLAGCSPTAYLEPTALPVPVQPTQLPTPEPVVEEPVLVQPEPTETVMVKPTVVEKPMNNSGTIPIPEDPLLNSFVTTARDDLAKHLAVPAGQIDLVELSSVTWRDGSLGCPKPGMIYTQALVEGMLIRFRSGGIIYEYHSGGKRQAFYCENPTKALPSEDK